MDNPFVLVNPTIWDAANDDPFLGSIGVKEGKIAFVHRTQQSIQVDWPRVDLAGKWVIPGLIDCHVHLCSPIEQGVHEPYWKLTTPPSSKILYALHNAQETLKAGFTTVRNCGGVSYGAPEDILLRNAIKGAVVAGPRIIACGGGITMTGGHGDRGIPAFMERHPESGLGEIPADGADACRREVRRKIRMGADFIKIYTTGGVSTPGDGPDSVDFTMQELESIMDEAHLHGKLVATHAQGNKGIRNAVIAGVNTVEHGSFLDEETAALMAEKGISLVPTLGIFKAILARGKEYPNQEAIRKAEIICEAQSSAVRLAKAAGVNIALGTDASVSIRNGENGLELLELAKEGLSPSETLKAATCNAARAIGLSNQIGCLEEGKRADILVLDRNPFENLEALAKKESILAVMSQGHVHYSRGHLREVLN
jgi:imidazolonepropionase-like amidohydrolase